MEVDGCFQWLEQWFFMLASWLQSRFVISRLFFCSCTNISWRRCSSRSNSKSIDLPFCKIIFLCTRAILVILSVPLSLDWFYFHDVLNTRRLHEQQLQLVSRADERVLRNPQPSQAATRAWRFTASQGLHLIMMIQSWPWFFPKKFTDFYISDG